MPAHTSPPKNHPQQSAAFSNNPASPELPVRGRRATFKHAMAMMLMGMVFFVSIGVAHGLTMIEKVLTELAAPVGFVWLILSLLVYLSLLGRQYAMGIIALIAWLVLTIGGNSLVSNTLIGVLEAPYRDLPVFELDRFDVLVVLGGGTSYRPSGFSQFDESGDRVGLVARLYHAGKAEHIICTGSSTYRYSEDEPHVREQAAELLQSLIVPADKISLVAGENTSQELWNLRRHLEATGQIDSRIGIITSAWHLPRAMRLAQANELTLIPVPADVKSRPYRPSPNLFIPGAQQLANTRAAIKEYLAMLIGR